MEDPAFVVGKWFGFLVFALFPVLFLRDAIRAATTSLRLANLALFCGLAFFIFPEVLIGRQERGPALAIAGVRILLGMAGLVLAIFALVVRGRDHGTGVARPIVGLVLAGMHGLIGCVFLMQPIFSTTQPDPRTAWTYIDPTHGFQVQLPSNRWQQFTGDRGLVSFGHPRPKMLCSIIATRAGQSQADYEAAARASTAYVDSSPARKTSAKHREGVTPQGDPFTLSTCMDNGSSGSQVYVATVVHFCKKKGLVVQLVFEGQPTMMSQVGQETERSSFETAAEYILTSVQ